MFFLLRLAFWLGLVLVLLPRDKTPEADNTPQVSASDAVSAATATINDMGQFCKRQPSACEVGGQAATAIGQRGHRAEASRLIEIVMTENQFTPNRISVRRGETVRFVLRNTDDSFHEFNIGTAVTHVAHRKEMLTMVENGVIEIDRVDHAGTKMGAGGGATMMHDDPNGKLLEPGSSAEIVWKFDAEARLEFACNVPGHYERGMKGEIRIR